MKPKVTYWQTGEDRVPAEGDPRQMSRRGFFQVMGLSAAAFASACKRAPTMKLIPFVAAPEEAVPGQSLWYASTCGACPARCGILVKSRDGRPIKIEGNPEHPWSRGGLCAVGQASVLSLYDASRTRRPRSHGKATTFERLDAEVTAALARLAAAGKAIRLVTPYALGPTEEAAVRSFLARYPTARRVIFDPQGQGAVAAAHAITHGIPAAPTYRFDRARLVASFGADFLGTWRSPVAFTADWASRRAAGHGMSRLVQVESYLSLTGSNADRRIVIAPSDEAAVVLDVARRIAERAAADGALRSALAGPAPRADSKKLARLAAEIWEARSEALVVSGSREVAVQVAVNVVNHLVGVYGTTLELGTAGAGAGGASAPDAGPAPMSFDSLLAELPRGEVGALVLYRVNPVYAHPEGAAIADLVRKVPLTAAVADRGDETASLAQHLAPSSHFLESWDDAEPRAGILGLAQPLIRPLFETRPAPESLLRWAGETAPWEAFLKRRWEAEVFPRASRRAPTFQAFWDQSVHDGFAELAGQAPAPPAPPPAAAPPPAPPTSPSAPLGAFRLDESVAALRARTQPHRAGAGELELVLYEKVGMRDGSLANNGWLQELPDPISKVTWGNYAALSPARAAKMGLRDGAVVAIEAGGRRIELPVLVQPGTHPDVVAVAVGYGRTRVGRIGNGVGANAFVLANARTVTLRDTGRRDKLALSQVHHSQEGRPLVREATLEEFLANPRAGNPAPPPRGRSLWPEHKYEGHRWGMAIDLSKCTGCSACVVSCQAENNIPMVGKEEVWRRREMHWLRIDRYYTGSPEAPAVVHQPMTCLHCENAPCETVCPVLATVHSTEGLNQQVYARCVGTRYCANNCPPKVRRFNWFDYDRSDTLANLVLNPDVTVRVRGVMEKCSMCVQRIQEGKARAQAAGRPLHDGEIRTACEQSCPAGAIVFGDLNDPKGRLAKLVASGRYYVILDELNLKPVVGYLTKIRNPGRSGADA